MVTMRGDRQAVLDALANIRRSLEVDGYRLEVDSATADDLLVTVTALEGACEECFAPAEVVKMIISGGIDGAYSPDEIELRLPEPGVH
jgi:hypothetical protein